MEKQLGFKPYYNWNTFNTKGINDALKEKSSVLNLIITGIPSILTSDVISYKFKVLKF